MNMIYAALLLHSAKKEINENNLKKVAKAVEDNIDEAQIKALVTALEGINIEEAIKSANFPVATAAVPVEATKEKKEIEEKKEEETEKKAEEAAAALSSLFG